MPHIDSSPGGVRNRMNSGYRPEVDSIRALSIAFVVTYHYAPDLLPGGFFGVDVFFVVSGYFVTAMFRSRALTAANLADFWLRRVKRIVPALLVAIALSTLFLPAIVYYTEFEIVAEEAISALLFYSNFFFMQGHDYLNDAAARHPFQHTWSLSIEMQYYLLAPLLVAVFTRNAAAILVGLIASLALFLALALATPAEVAFFNPAVRLVEFACGSAALMARVMVRDKRITRAVAVAAFTLLLASVAAYQNQFRHPGLYTLCVVASSAVLVATAFPLPLPMVAAATRYLGRISYSVYLYHWLVLYLYSRFFSQYAADAIAICLLVTLALSAVSYHGVERPLRRRTVRWRAEPLLRVLPLAVLTLGYFGFVKATDGTGTLNAAAIARYIDAQTQVPVFVPCERHALLGAGAGLHCTLGTAADPDLPRFVVWGDSHSASLGHLFDTLGGELGMGGWLFHGGGCPTALDIHIGAIDWCPRHNEDVLTAILAANPRAVFLVNRWTLYTDFRDTTDYRIDANRYTVRHRGEVLTEDQIEPVFVRAIGSIIERLRTAGIAVVLVDQVPQMRRPGPIAAGEAFARTGEPPITMRFEDDYDRAVRGHWAVILAELTRRHDVPVIDPRPTFCTQATCRFVDQGRVLFLDEDHLNDTGAAQLAGVVRPYLAALAPSGQ